MVKAHPFLKGVPIFMCLVRKIFVLALIVVITSCGWSSTQVNWCDISNLWNEPGKTNLTFIDLFCGAGGLSKGLEYAGFQGVCGLDYFKEAGKTYSRNFTFPYLDGDVTLPETKTNLYQLVKERLHGNRLSLVVGGFPCQGFSMAGNRVVADPRNALYLEMIEIVNHLKPDYVVCENVKGIRSMLGGGVEKKIIDDFREIGYAMNVATLCAADYYVPQKRERVIFIGNRIGKTNYHPKPILQADKYITVGQAIGDLLEAGENASINHIFTKHSQEMISKIGKLKEGESLYPSYSESWRRCFWNQASPTVKENHGGVIIHPKLSRVMTVRELARLQTFPDDFIFEGGKAQQLVQIGNAVPVLLGKAIGLSIRYSLGDLK